mmetsp:Transcript_19794/g.29150  ORF Transcript_19794/g.29150 Transcript_19794/m.29150 type:complete len:221 (+) Transcript_19794:205-867(+)
MYGNSFSKSMDGAVNIDLGLGAEVLHNPFRRTIEVEVPLMKPDTTHFCRLIDRCVNTGYSSNPDGFQRLHKCSNRTFCVIQCINNYGKINSVQTNAFCQHLRRAVCSTKCVEDLVFCEHLVILWSKGVHCNNLSIDYRLHIRRCPFVVTIKASPQVCEWSGTMIQEHIDLLCCVTSINLTEQLANVLLMNVNWKAFQLCFALILEPTLFFGHWKFTFDPT